jgi:hypothetical protein
MWAHGTIVDEELIHLLEVTTRRVTFEVYSSARRKLNIAMRFLAY